MIVKASFRKPGGLSAHLQRTDNNEQVIVSGARDLPLDIDQSLGLLAVMGSACQGERSLIHVIAAPSPSEAPPTDRQRERFWELYEEEFDLRGHPFVEVTHQKGKRPSHIHRVYARRHPTSGHSVHDGYLKIRNEKVARVFEIECGHDLTVGKHQRAVRNALERERPDIADAIDPVAQPRSFQPVIDRDETQQAESRGIDPRAFRAKVYALYALSGGDWKAFAAALDRKGLSVARGDKTIMVLDARTGYAVSLPRLLRSEAKAAGRPIKLTSRDLETIFAKARPLAEERRLAAMRAAEASERANTFAGIFEELAKGDLAMAAQDYARRVAAHHQDQRFALEFGYRADIQAHWQRYHAAKDFSYVLHDNKSLLFAITLCVSGSVIPALLLTHGLLAIPDAVARGAREAAEELRRQSSNRRQFSFAEIDNKDRLIYGAYAHALLGELSGDQNKDLLTTCKKLIPEASAARFAEFFETCSPHQFGTITSWFRPGDSHHMDILNKRTTIAKTTAAAPKVASARQFQSPGFER